MAEQLLSSDEEYLPHALSLRTFEVTLTVQASDEAELAEWVEALRGLVMALVNNLLSESLSSIDLIEPITLSDEDSGCALVFFISSTSLLV